MRSCLIIIILSLISACSNVKGNWSCKTLKGQKGHCISIRESDIFSDFTNNFNKGNSLAYSASNQETNINLVAPKLSKLRKIAKELDLRSPANNLDNDLKLRSQEKIGRIWFASHIDAKGNQHMEKIVYVIDEKPQWIMRK